MGPLRPGRPAPKPLDFLDVGGLRGILAVLSRRSERSAAERPAPPPADPDTRAIVSLLLRFRGPGDP